MYPVPFCSKVAHYRDDIGMGKTSQNLGLVYEPGQSPIEVRFLVPGDRPNLGAFVRTSQGNVNGQVFLDCHLAPSAVVPG